MRGLFKNKWFLIIIITVLLLVFSGVSAKVSKLGRLTNLASIAFSPMQKLISTAGNSVENSFSFIANIRYLHTENEQMKKKLDLLEKENLELKEFKQENKELRQSLGIKQRFSDFELIGANIIAKDMGNYFNIFTIDRGAKDGITKDSPVVTSKGLVGRILQVDAFSSKVEAIIDKNSILSARISQKGDYVRVKGDIDFKDQGLCLMDRISNDVDVSVGDDIVTSGIGGIYPRGIIIGRVKETRKTSDELSKYALIQTAVDFKRLDEVIILKAKNN